MALTVADAFRNIWDAARQRRRVITTCNAIGVAYLTETRSKQSEKEAGVVGAALSVARVPMRPFMNSEIVSGARIELARKR